MVSYSSFSIFVLLIVAPTATSATTYIVGDESGWTVGFDYQAWAQDKTFQVGDKLVFWYPAGAHNVYRVNGTDFRNCTIPRLGQALTSGNDTLTLATPGNKWYFCGVGAHCASGQKLAITVHSYAPTPSPSMAPSPSPIPYSHSGSDGVNSECDAPAPSPVEDIPWGYFTPAPSPVELSTGEYDTPTAPSPAETVPWEYFAPAPAPVGYVPWWYMAPAPAPAADTGYTEKAAEKRPFINFLRE
ncbi:Blue copper protein [Euphorbia peplus]|nr:Blue copper protein [Euphorbia peplus]